MFEDGHLGVAVDIELRVPVLPHDAIRNMLRERFVYFRETIMTGGGRNFIDALEYFATDDVFSWNIWNEMPDEITLSRRDPQ